MKKVVSLLLALVLIFAMSSVAMADVTTVTTEAELTNAITNGGDVVDVALGASFETAKTIIIPAGKTVNLDLNGYTLTTPHNYVDGTNIYAFIVEDGGTLTLDDTSDAQTGKIACKYSGVETKGGTFIMEGGKIEAADMIYAGAVVNYGGKVIINDGEIIAYDSCVTAAAYFTSSATVEINGGSITLKESTNNYMAVEIGGSNNVNGEASVEINGGTIDGYIYAWEEEGTAALTITGGTFSNSYYIDPSDYVASGSDVIVNEDGSITVIAPEPKAAKRYDVNVADTKNGEITVKGSASYDSGVVISVLPYYGYELSSLTVTKADGTKVALTERADGTYSFSMPRGEVTVKATFAPIGDAVKMVLTIGSKTAIVDGKAVTSDVAPVIKAGRTFLPIRLIAENLGAKVEWNNATNEVTITGRK